MDLDDTLVDSEAAYASALQKLGLTPQSQEYSEARAAVKARLGNGHPGARNRLLYFKELLLRRGKTSPSQLLEWTQTYEAGVLEHIVGQWRRLNRVTLFRDLASAVPLAVVTNENTRLQTSKLAALDPDGFFSQVVTSEEMGVEKPAPVLFEEAVRRLAVNPEHCLAVGNAFETDVAPALKLGMAGVLTTEFQPNRANLPTEVKVISRLDQLRDCL